MGDRGQSAIELVVLVIFVMIFFSAFLAALQINRADMVREKRVIFMNDVAMSVRDEINLATSSVDGYIRTFNVPSDAFGLPINVSIQENFVYVMSIDGRNALVQPILNVSGNLSSGTNFIRRANGSVYLNR